jgi:hypothetical protein
MRRRLMNLGLVIAVWGSVMMTPSAALSAAPPQTGSPPNPAGRAPLTNADVVRILQALTNSIRSGPVKFDLSPAGLAALRQAGVSDEMVRLMEQAERQSQAQAATSAGGPVPAAKPGTSPVGDQHSNPTPQQMDALRMLARNLPTKVSPIYTNPAAGQANAALINLLRQQKQTAMTERDKSTPPAGRPPSPDYGRVALARTAGPMVAPSAASSSNSLAKRATTADLPNVAVACATFNSPMIQAVSGQSGSTAVFSQDPEFNPFTIKGCNFGNVAGRSQLNAPNGGKLADLTIDSWTDNLITVELTPTLVNVLDQNNVTLVLFPPNKPQAQRAGFKFYAMRREMLLTSIPRDRGTAQVSVTNDDSGQRVNPYFSTPYRGLSFVIAEQTNTSPAQVSPNLDQGWTAGVDRVNAVRFPAGTDVFSFDGLAPGFVLEKFQIDERNIEVCRAGAMYYIGTALEGGLPIVGIGDLSSAANTRGVTNYSDGTWSAAIAQNTIRVNWVEGHCHATDGNDSSNSSYALKVWVVGPALSPGTSPWKQ